MIFEVVIFFSLWPCKF